MTKFFRNKREVNGQEPDSLWMLQEYDYLVLVNDDEHVRVKQTDFIHDFYEVEQPPQLVRK